MVSDKERTAVEFASDGTHVRTFLFADIRGYTTFTQEHGDEAAGRLAGKYAEIVRRTVERRDGTLLELQGDGALCVFTSTRQAIRASIDLQRRFVEETVADPSLPFPVGIGLDAGEAVSVEGGYRGGALNLGARLCAIAGPGEILASREVVHLARKVDGVAAVDRGTVQLKGIANPVHVMRLKAEADDAAEDVAFRRALGASGARLQPAGPGAIVANPYKGLRAFEEGDAPDFHGRGALIEQLVERLSETRFLAVVGPSGSGKSSVVRAGLIPALRRGAIPASDAWPIADMFPGPYPLDGLEAALLKIAADQPPSLIEQLRADERGLNRAVLRVLPSDRSELVLVIDQFEEVFTLVDDEEVRRHFLASLEAAVSDPHSRLRVVVTLRADFYDRPLRYRGFADLFAARVESLVPLSAEQLEQVITKPAERADVSLESGLVAAMLADVAEEPGALPLLEYALTELFERREGRMLTLGAYREIGGVSGALGRRAEEIYDGIDGAGKDAARQLFLHLVALGEGTEDTRRRVSRAEITSLDLDQQAMSWVIETYGTSRQLTFDRDVRTGEPTIELAHEAMLSAWPRLGRWIDAARDDIRTERRLAAAAREWAEADRDPSFLIAGSRLEQIEAWRAGSPLALTPEEAEFLDASVVERDRAQAEERSRQEHERELERRSVRRLRAIVAVLGVAAVIAGALTVFAMSQQREAQSQERTAQARELAAASVANLDVDPERSILLALEAIEATRSVDGAVLTEAEEALHRATTASRIVMSVPGLGGALDWSSAGVFVTEGPEDSGIIDLRDAGSGKRVIEFPGHDVDVNDVRFSPDGSMLATGGDDGALKVWDPVTGDLLWQSAGTGSVWGPSFDARGTLVSAAWEGEGVVRVFDTSDGRLVGTIETTEPPFMTALSPSGGAVAVSSGASLEVGVYDVASGRLTFELRGHAWPVNRVSWSPDGRWIATAGNDSSARIWDARAGRSTFELIGHSGGVASVDWSPDGGRLVTGSFDGTAKIWHVGDGGARELLSLSGQDTRSGVTAVFSPDGDGVMTGAWDISAVKIWDVSIDGNAELANFRTDSLAPVDVDFLPDGRVVAPSDRGSASIWDVENGARAKKVGPGQGSTFPVTEVVTSPDGKLIATVRLFANVVDVWDPEAGTRSFDADVEGEVAAVDWGAGGDLLAIATSSGSTTIVDRNGSEVAVLREDDVEVTDAVFSGDGTLLATSAGRFDRPDSWRMTIWDVEEERQIERFPQAAGVAALAFHPSDPLVAVAHDDGTVDVVNARSGSSEVTLAGSDAVGAVSFSPDGARLATAGEDGTVRLFDAASGVRLLVLRAHDYLVSGISFSDDGRWLATASPDGVVRVWALDLDELIEIAKRKVTRELSDEECLQYLHVETCP
ncbi:MAG TPA: adenylate/guanylate cyclase domain-containing protein [Actinomycetota bacterium]|nr:adenylate/guanylate cyclase domain-containing protein [Actinomycetota bacterium]